MRKVLIGLLISAAVVVVVLSARRGLEEHAGIAPESAHVDPASGAAETADPVGGGTGPEAAAAAGSSSTNLAAPGAVVSDSPSRRSAEGVRPTDRSPTHPDPGPRPLSPSPAGDPADGAEQDQEVAKVLRRAAEVYAKSGSLQADFSQRTVNPILRSTVTSSGTLYQRHPDRFLMRFSDPEGDLIVSDGTHFWVYYPSVDRRQVIRMPASRGAGGVDLQAQFVGDPLERFGVVFEGREDVGGRSTYVLLLNPKRPLGYRSLKVWIDAGDHLIRRFELTEESGLVRHFELSNLRLNVRLGDDLFHFVPPEGAQVVDRG